MDLKRSFPAGDKISDTEAGYRAGRKTKLVLTGHGSDELKKNPNMNMKPNYIPKDSYAPTRITTGH